jgi:hypothetical protein
LPVPHWVTWAEIIAQAAVLCPRYRTRAWLRDAAGSAQNGIHVTEQIDQILGRALGNEIPAGSSGQPW